MYDALVSQRRKCSGWVGDVYILNHEKPFSTHFRDWDFGPDAYYVLLLKVSCSYTFLVHWHVECVITTSIL